MPSRQGVIAIFSAYSLTTGITQALALLGMPTRFPNCNAAQQGLVPETTHLATLLEFDTTFAAVGVWRIKSIRQKISRPGQHTSPSASGSSNQR